MNQDQASFTTSTNCPLCNRSILLTWQADKIPFFDEVLHTSVQCECGFRYADTMILTQRDPVRFTQTIQSVDDLKIRVIRSSSGTIHIPELEIDIEPGPASESYVSNVEGVLCRIEDVLKMVSRWEDEPPSSIDKANELLNALEKVKQGKMKITLIIEDPLGNSAILSEDAVVEKLSPEEAKRLKTGMIVLEKDDLPDHL